MNCKFIGLNSRLKLFHCKIRFLLRWCQKRRFLQPHSLQPSNKITLQPFHSLFFPLNHSFLDEFSSSCLRDISVILCQFPVGNASVFSPSSPSPGRRCHLPHITKIKRSSVATEIQRARSFVLKTKMILKTDKNKS